MAKNYMDNIVTVQNLLDRRTLLEGLAEEAAELSQAALKLIRAEKNEQQCYACRRCGSTQATVRRGCRCAVLFECSRVELSAQCLYECFCRA